MERFRPWLPLLLVVPPLALFGSGPSTVAASAVGDVAPRFSLTDVNGHTWTSDDLLGSVVVLEFWATWCPSCQANMPAVARLAGDYATRPVRLIAVNVRAQENADARAFLEQAGLDLTLVLDGDALADRFGVRGTPTAVVVDATGKIAYSAVGSPDGRNARLRQAVDAALSERERGAVDSTRTGMASSPRAGS